ncbi:MAG: hypothetical protein GX495_15620 [Chloroflexi bacterium]|nr:hypothetical protein [Chloroflexota bacterium]
MLKYIHDPISQIQEDCLERHIFVQAIHNQLASDSCPSAVGLFGDWGTGKSSLLQMLVEWNKQAEKKLDIQIFDAWLYESTGNLFTPILVWIKNQLKQQGKAASQWGPGMKRVFQATFWTLGKTVVKLGMLQVGISSPDKAIDVLTEIPDEFERQYKTAEEKAIPQLWEKLVDDIEQAREDFQMMVDLLLEGQPHSKLVFCIDNLDRCSPEQAVHMLQSIKNYLSVEGVVWLIAVDPHVISAYIEKQYGTGAIGGYNYLDKIFPEQYHIPPLSIQSNALQVERLLERALSGIPVQIRPTNWQRYAQIPRVLVPRRLIKSARKFAQVCGLPTTMGMAVSADTMFALILLYHSWPDFYERMSSDQREHVQSVLLNFLDDRIRADYPTPPLPLPPRFIEDRDLQYYIRQAFLTYGRIEETSGEIALATHFLHQVGLP